MKRVLSIVLCVVMVLSMTVAAEDSGSATSKLNSETVSRLSRSMAVMELYKLHIKLGGSVGSYKTNPFSNLKGNSESYQPILWAYYYGLLDWCDDGTFKPNEPVTREEVCTMLYCYDKRACWILKQNGNTTDFKDADSISSWATDAVQFCQKAGIINGYEDGTFRPQNSVQIAEFAAMIYLFEQNISNRAYDYVEPEDTAEKDIEIQSYADPFEGIDITEFENPYADISGDEWYYEPLAYLSMAGILDDLDFFPAGTVSNSGNEYIYPDAVEGRGNTVHALQNAHKNSGGKVGSYTNNPFVDVAKSDSYYQAVLWAAHNEIVNGYGDGTFGPMRGITREQMCKILYKYAQDSGLTLKSGTKAESFKDYESISSWAKEGVAACQKAGIITGYEDGTFKPQNSITRKEVITMIYRFINACGK